MKKNTEITVLSETVRVQRIAQEDFISLTDIAKFRNPDAIEQMEILTGEYSRRLLGEGNKHE